MSNMISVQWESSLSPPSGYTKDEYVKIITDACEIQSQKHWGPPWWAHPIHLSHVRGHQITCHLVDEDKEVPGALAYHWTKGEVADLVVMMKTIRDAGGDWFTGTLSIPTCLSHEVLEMNGDIWCRSWWDMDNGYQMAAEMCDPVQASGYDIKIKRANGLEQKVTLSNFVLPAWSNPDDHDGPYDYLHHLDHPGQVEQDGYAIRRTLGKESEVHASKLEVVGDIPSHHGYRSMRRLGFKDQAEVEAVKAMQ
jgi:hypothetical protein